VAPEGPFRARSFQGLARGAVRYTASAPQTISSTGGDPQVAAAIDPVTGGGDDCATTKTDASPGTAVYSLPASAGYMLLGAPSIRARLTVTGTNAQVAARLWDVAPDGKSQTLVARGTYRPDSGEGTQHFQLHANGWRFAAGHVPKLELLGADAPYTRVSNGAFQITVSTLELTLPTR
jgi:ABC-2 type transport system ATP-binding protein